LSVISFLTQIREKLG